MERKQFIVIVRKYESEEEFDKLSERLGDVWVFRGFRRLHRKSIFP